MEEIATEYVPSTLRITMKSYDVMDYIRKDKNGWARRNQHSTKVITCTRRDGSTYPFTVVGNPISNAVKEALEAGPTGPESEYEVEEVRLHPTGCVIISKNKFVPSVEYSMEAETWETYAKLCFAASLRDMEGLMKTEIVFKEPKIWRRKK